MSGVQSGHVALHRRLYLLCAERSIDAMTTPTPGQVKLTEDQYERIELLIDNAATASQCREMLRDDDGIESGLREAVRMNVAEPLMRELAALRASSHPALHASAPEGHLCADCTMDKEPCPTCYSAWWSKSHPNLSQV